MQKNVPAIKKKGGQVGTRQVKGRGGKEPGIRVVARGKTPMTIKRGG